MTVTADRDTRVIVSASGFSNPIPFDQYVEDSAHIEVYADTEQMTLGVDYTIAGLLDDDGIEVTITATGLANYDPDEYIVFHKPPMTQGEDLSMGGRFGTAYEKAVDALARRMQSLADRVDRALRLPVNTPLETEGGELPVAAPNQIIGWNDDATGLENKGTVPQLETVAGIAEDIAALALIADEITALSAVDSELVTLAPVAAQIATLATVAANIATLAPISADITTVAGVSANVATLATVAAEIAALGPISANIATVAGISVAVSTVAANIADIQAALADLPSLAAKLNLDGSNVGNAAAKAAFKGTIGVFSPPQGRITLTSGTPVTTSDVTAATTVYYTPYVGDQVPISDGTKFYMYAFSELSFALDSDSGHSLYHQASRNYDVFIANDAGTLRAGTGPQWSGGAGVGALRGTGAGTTELERVNGVWVNKNVVGLRFGSASGNVVNVPAQRATYVGTLRMTANGQTEDSIAKRFVWNCYNRVLRALKAVEATDNWAYTTATMRQARGSAANQVEMVRGINEDAVNADLTGVVANTNAGVRIMVTIGLDSTTEKAADAISGVTHAPVANYSSQLKAAYRGLPGLGYHYLAWLEWSAATGTTTFYGDGNEPTMQQSGLIANALA